jgi:hypothetical protein
VRGNGFAYAANGQYLCRLSRRLNLGGNGFFDIFHHDSAPRPGATHLIEVYPMLLCHPSGDRCHLD